MSKTKEEIVSNIKWALRSGCKRSCSPSDHDMETCKCDRDIITILDEYAQQVSINFFYWVQVHATPCTSEDKWWLGDKKYTIPELFTQFKKQKS
jgi:hypothetical protein